MKRSFTLLGKLFAWKLMPKAQSQRRKCLFLDDHPIHRTVGAKPEQWIFSSRCYNPRRDPLTGPPSHWSPSHWSPNSLVPQYIIGAHWSPISLVPHIIGPPSHWPPFSLVTPSSANPNGPPSHWSPISLVPLLIGPPTHQSPISLVPQLAPMHHPFHWSPI